MDYKKIYRAENSYEAHFVKGLLNKYSVNSRLLGENLSIVIGELPVDVFQVEILVKKNQIKKTKDILFDYEKNFSLDQSKEDWECSSCMNFNPFSFDLCWNCG